MTQQPEEHWIPADGGIGLHAWVYRPDRGSRGEPVPAISMAHGFGAIKNQGLIPYAQRFARAGFLVIVHDHRSFGLSGGWPRNDIDPWRQILDWRRVITYLQEIDGVDSDRIGLWGSSYAGGHAPSSLVLTESTPQVFRYQLARRYAGFCRTEPETTPENFAGFYHGTV